MLIKTVPGKVLSASIEEASPLKLPPPPPPPLAAISLTTNSVVAICVLFVPTVAVGAVGVPVKAGEALFALRFRAVCVAVETGFAASEVSLTLPSPRFVRAVAAFVKSDRFDDLATFASSAVCVAVETGFAASEVLSTLPSPRLARASPGFDKSDKFDDLTSFVSRAVCAAVDTGFDASDVLSAFPNPTSDFDKAKSALNCAGLRLINTPDFI